MRKYIYMYVYIYNKKVVYLCVTPHYIYVLLKQEY